MELVLFQNQAFNLSNSPRYDQTKAGKRTVKRATLRFSKIPANADQTLQTILLPLTTYNSGSSNLITEVGFFPRRNVSSGYNGFLSIRDSVHNGVLETLSNFCEGGLKLRIDLTLRDTYNNLGYDINWEKIEFDVIRCNILETYFGEKNDNTLGFSYCQSTLINGFIGVSGSITVTAILPDSITTTDATITDKLSINKKILLEELRCDVIIVSNNGIKIKCHKSFLIAHSTVFQTMFQSSMEEAETSTVEIPHMAEESVRALLAYLYYWETKQSQENSLICFELFSAGHEYDIGSLEICMKNILLKKENEWHDVDVAMRLFLFSRNLPDGDELKMKAIQVLKSKFSELEQSECYQELFRKDTKAAMDLCRYAFSV